MLFPQLFNQNVHHPFHALEDFHRQFNQLFNEWAVDSQRDDLPPVNIWKTSDGLALTAELPGVHADDIELSVHQNQLTLSGKRKPLNLSETDKLYRQERDYGDFERKFELPLKVDVTKIEAKFADGILRVELPQAEEDKPKKISIQPK